MLVIMLNKFTILRSSVMKVSPDYPWPWEGAPPPPQGLSGVIADIAGSGRRATAPRVWKPATESLKRSHKKSSSSLCEERTQPGLPGKTEAPEHFQPAQVKK